jgi:hypothetical protein
MEITRRIGLRSARKSACIEIAHHAVGRLIEDDTLVVGVDSNHVGLRMLATKRTDGFEYSVLNPETGQIRGFRIYQEADKSKFPERLLKKLSPDRWLRAAHRLAH